MKLKYWLSIKENTSRLKRRNLWRLNVMKKLVQERMTKLTEEISSREQQKITLLVLRRR